MTNSSQHPTVMLPRDAPPSPRGGQALMLAIAMLAVAVVSGLVWWLIRHDSDSAAPGAGVPVPADSSATSSTEADEGTPSSSTVPDSIEAGRFTYNALAPADVSENCAKVSYGKVEDWFEDKPCEHVVRGLYTTKEDGARALVSVAVVTMPDAAQAKDLKTLTDTSGTGNVSDMQRDGSVPTPGGPRVAGGGYASNIVDNTVTIIESAFYDGHRDRTLLNEITSEALGIASHMR